MEDDFKITYTLVGILEELVKIRKIKQAVAKLEYPELEDLDLGE